LNPYPKVKKKSLIACLHLSLVCILVVTFLIQMLDSYRHDKVVVY
jgi:hypothetical protein